MIRPWPTWRRIEFSAVTVDPDDDEPEPEALEAEPPRGFTIAGSQVVVDITLRDADGEPIRELETAVVVCLAVSDELLAEAADRPLTLLHYDPEDGWTTLENPELRTPADDGDGPRLLCAETTRLSPFAVGYRLDNDADLKNAGDRRAVSLRPSFEPTRLSYRASVPHATTTVTVTAGAAHPSASLAITPADADAGT